MRILSCVRGGLCLSTRPPCVLYVCVLANVSFFDHHVWEEGGCRVKLVNLSIEEHFTGGEDVQFTTPLATLIPQAGLSFHH